MSEKKSSSKKHNTSGEAESTSATADSHAAPTRQKIFILKAQSKNLKNAEHFLRNREFEVISTTDIKVAINNILSGQAAYIMLSTDHANPKVMKLPAIIHQSFNTPIILFSEGLSPKGMALLRESRHPYVLYPPLSGPATERMILKIERDKKEKSEEALNGKSLSGTESQGEDSPSTFKFSGSSKLSQDEIIMQSKKAQQEFAKIFAGEPGLDSNISNLNYDAAASGEMMHQGSSSTNEQENPTDFSSDKNAEAVREYLNSDSDVRSVSLQDQSDSLKDNSDSSQSPILNHGVAFPKFIGLNRKGDLYIPPKDTSAEIIESNESSEAEAAKSSTITALPSRQGVNILTFKTNENASFLIKGTKHALENSSKFVQGKKIAKNTACTKVSCFNIESIRFSGYVIVAFGEKDKIDEQFNKSVQMYLCEYLKLNGLEVQMADLTALKIKEVNFEEWSIREADFLMTSIHEGSEIAVAFFPHDKKEAPLELSAEAHMAKMTIDEIKPDEPVEFDVYIYLPANAKYVRYTQQNGIMYSSQKERLKRGGHDKIHIRKESESHLSRYRVQNFLNDKIESFKKSKKVS